MPDKYPEITLLNEDFDRAGIESLRELAKDSAPAAEEGT